MPPEIRHVVEIGFHFNFSHNQMDVIRNGLQHKAAKKIQYMIGVTHRLVTDALDPAVEDSCGAEPGRDVARLIVVKIGRVGMVKEGALGLVAMDAVAGHPLPSHTPHAC